MRVISAPVLLTVLGTILGLGCGSADMNESITQANEGVQLYQNGQLNKAEGLLEQATSLAPENHNAWYNLGLVRTELKKWDGAVEAFTEAVKLRGENSKYQYYLGRAHLRMEPPNYSLAQEHFEKATELDPKNYKSLYFLGKTYASQGKVKEAAEAWTKSASISSGNFANPFDDLSQLYIRWGFLDQAVAVLQAGLKRIEGVQEKSALYFHLGLAYQGKGQLKEAVDAYSKALSAHAGNKNARLQRGLAYADLKEKDNAIADLEAFINGGGNGEDYYKSAANQRLSELRAQQ